MSRKIDIIDGRLAAHRKYGLVYTRKCGWIDLGHANPDDGVGVLWKNLLVENGVQSDHRDYYVVAYGQGMAIKRKWLGNIRLGVEFRYKVKKKISIVEKRSVGLSILLNVSSEFESMQGSSLLKYFTDSGFSSEDLVSNLISFYRAVYPGTPFIMMCEPVSKEVALTIWDKYGAVGSRKNYSPVPILYPISGSNFSSPIVAQLPSFLNTIRPAVDSRLFQKLD